MNRVSRFPFALGLSKGAIWTILALLTSGCLGSFDAGGGNDGPGGGGGNPAKALFLSTVQPIMSSRCAGCHSGSSNTSYYFLGSSGEESYNKLKTNPGFIVPDPNTSALVSKGPHAGPGLTGDEPTKVKDWITAENNAGSASDMGATSGDSGTSGNLTADQQLARFAACLSETDWNETNMNTFQGESTMEGICSSCHSNSERSVKLSANSSQNFNALKTMSLNLLRIATYTSKSDGSFDTIVASDRWKLAGTENPKHPYYLLGANRVANLKSFFDRSKARWVAGNCP